jgi:hypothetical protein
MTKKWLLAWSPFIGHTLRLFGNLTKLVSNQIVHNFRIENLWQYPVMNVVLLVSAFSIALYVSVPYALIQQVWSAAGAALFHFFFAAWAIASRTIVFGDLIMRRRIAVARFLTND